MTVETPDISVDSAKKKKNTSITKTRKGAPTAQDNDRTFEKGIIYVWYYLFFTIYIVTLLSLI